MNSSLFLLLGLRGRLDPRTLHEMIVRGNEKRRKIFIKVADLLFGLVMLLFGQLKLKDAAGKDIDLSNPSSLSFDEKVNAILLSQDLTQRGLLFRELLRPALVSAAELLASLLEPDEKLLSLGSGGNRETMASAAMLPPMPAPAPVPAPVRTVNGQTVAPQAAPYDPSAPLGSEANPVRRVRGGNL